MEIIRWSLGRLAAAPAELQGLAGPEAVPALPGPTPNRIVYEGDPLTAAEKRAIREQIDFLRWKRAR